ncbi:MAG: hypothetical protein V1789_01240 [PVC group bacterium]
MQSLEISRERLKIAVWIFALVMLGLFAVFMAAVPVRSGTPQIFRLRYYALQQGVEGGPLSSSLADFDWRKAFVWRASDTEYRQRQFSQFFEVLTPRLYAHLYYWFGPFLWFPFSLLCALLIGFMITLVVRQWSGDWLPGLVAGSFWLLTTEVLVGHHAPIRYAKDLVTLEILGMVSLLLAMRGADRKQRLLCVIGACFIWWLGLFTDEYIIFLLPALAAAVLSWPWLKPVRFRLLASFLLLLAAGLLLFLLVLPDLISPDQKEPLAERTLRAMPSLAEKIVYNLRYLVLNTGDVFTYTFGWSHLRSGVQTGIAALAGVFLIMLILITRAWKGSGRMILFWLITAAAVGGILLPEGKDILHQHTYYNRPLVALLLVVGGLFTANIFRSGRIFIISAWLAGLLAFAVLNLAANSSAVKADPYLNKYGAEAILRIHNRIKSGELPAPVLVSYPQFRDVTGGVYRELERLPWHTLDDGSPPWSLYRSLMPRLYLRHFEEGSIRADPRQFIRWAGVDEHKYRSAANSFYDMPAGVVWDLAAIRKAAGPSAAGLVWQSIDGEKAQSAVVEDFLGEASFISLPAGQWRAELPLPPGVEDPVMIFVVRHQGPAVVSVPESVSAREIELSYFWSFLIHSFPLRRGKERARLVLETGGPADVIGPLIVPGEAFASFISPTGKDMVPAATPRPARSVRTPAE